MTRARIVLGWTVAVGLAWAAPGPRPAHGQGTIRIEARPDEVIRPARRPRPLPPGQRPLVLNELFVEDGQWRSLTDIGEEVPGTLSDRPPTAGDGPDPSASGAIAASTGDRDGRFRGSIDVDLVTAILTDRARQVALRAVADAIHAATGPGGDRAYVADLLRAAEGLLIEGSRLQRNRVEALVRVVVRVVLAEVLVRTRFPQPELLGRVDYVTDRICPRDARRRRDLGEAGRDVCQRLRIMRSQRSILSPAIDAPSGTDLATDVPEPAAEPPAARLGDARVEEQRYENARTVHLYLLDLAYWRLGSTTFFDDPSPRMPTCPWAVGASEHGWCQLFTTGIRDNRDRNDRVDFLVDLDHVLDGLLVARELRKVLRGRGVGLRGLLGAVLSSGGLGAFGESPGLRREDWARSVDSVSELNHWIAAAIAEIRRAPRKELARLLRQDLLNLADVADELGMSAELDETDGTCAIADVPGGGAGDDLGGGTTEGARVTGLAIRVCALERRLKRNVRRLERRLWPVQDQVAPDGSTRVRSRPVPIGEITFRGLGDLVSTLHAVAVDMRAYDELLVARREFPGGTASLYAEDGPEPARALAPPPATATDDADPGSPDPETSGLPAVSEDPGPEAAEPRRPPVNAIDPATEETVHQSSRALRGSDRMLRLFGSVDYHSARENGVGSVGGAVDGVGALGTRARDGRLIARLIEIFEPVLDYISYGRPADEGVLFLLVSRVTAEDVLAALGYPGREDDACGQDEASLACWVVRIVLALDEATTVGPDRIQVDGAVLRDTLAALGDDFRSRRRWRPYFHLTIGLGALATFRSPPGAAPEDEVDGILVQPIVAEQIGIGAASPSFGRDRFTFRAGAYASGILYRIVFDSQESDAVIFGAFAALDLYELIEIFVAPSILLFPATAADRVATRFGVSVGAQVPLGDYLSDL